MIKGVGSDWRSIAINCYNHKHAKNSTKMVFLAAEADSASWLSRWLGAWHLWPVCSIDVGQPAWTDTTVLEI